MSASTSLEKPIPFDDFMARQDMRDEAWRRRFVMDTYFANAKPGRGHLALASLYRLGKVPAVITQNIDNLHQVSGVSHDDVVELHGNTTFATCTGCGARYELDWVKQKFEAEGGRAPDCACGGHIKTATVSFGQAMPEDAMLRAHELSGSCDLFLSIGSSLVVCQRLDFRCGRSSKARGWSSSIASRRNSTRWRISLFATISATYSVLSLRNDSRRVRARGCQANLCTALTISCATTFSTFSSASQCYL